ncbi:uncharacterized protein LOC121741982 isoform X1 [Salvia splendens]|uniref:uncharacterized protein LOC121741982 isoform X1 n=2 Tax=Salvia splendens TaxID=180675 RepID=UPI001C26952A|nr:uncharacterized protein LOC121741982 isoform X1 [Salvia splendens]
MESPERGRPVIGIALEFPVSDGVLSCSPPTIPSWLRRRLSEPKTPTPSTVEEIEAKLRDADLRRQKFYENLASKARPKVRSPSRSSSTEDDLGQRLEAKLLAAEEKRLSILANAQMRLAKLDELRQAAKSQVEMRFKKERAELGSKVEMRVQQAEANRLLILRANRQRRATLRERTSQSLMRRVSRESKYKERVRAAMCQKRAEAEKKRLSLLEAEKRRAHARGLKVQTVASFVSQQREIERSELKNKLEDKLQKARRLRAEYLKQRGRQYNAYLCSWETINQQGDILAKKLPRYWRNFKNLRKTTAYLSKAYGDLDINERSVKSMPFEQFALLIQSHDTLHAAKALLDRLEIRHRLSQGSANRSSFDDIDHLLKRVASPQKKQVLRKFGSSRMQKETAKSTHHMSRYQVRVVLCAYMILGHPDAVISGRGERETALVNSAKKFVEEFDLLMKILLNGPMQISDKESDRTALSRRTFRLQLAAFDSAWCSFLNSFVVWKAKDARSLEEDLVRAACRLEVSMIQTCKMTPQGGSAPLSHDMRAIQKQVSEDQKLLREKVQHLSGDAGIERMETAISDTRTKFFEARENQSPISPPTPIMLSPGPASSSSRDKAGNFVVAPCKESSVVRSLFKDDVDAVEAGSSLLKHRTSSSSRGSLDMENARIVNEYVHGAHLAFTDNFSDAGEDHIASNIKETMEKAFWDGIMESVRQDEPNYSRIVELMGEVRDEICAMAPHTWRQEIIEVIDLEILTQVLNSGKLDISYFGKILDYALITLRKLSAPAYEDELNKKHQKFMKDLADTFWAGKNSENSHIMALIKGLRFALEQIKDLKHEISKAHIQLLEPVLKGPEALYYIGRTFTNRYGQPTNARSALPLTARWLSSIRQGKDEEWDEHESLVSELRRRHGILPSYLPSTTLRTGGSALIKAGGEQTDKSSTSKTTGFIETIDPHLECKGEDIDLTVRLGLLKLVSRITGLAEGELPETMSLNFSRLRSVQSQIQKIIVMSTSLLVLRQTLLAQQIVSSQTHMDTLLSGCVKRLSQCLDVADAGIQEIVEILGSAVEEDTKSADMKQIMARMLSKSLQEGDAIFTKVSRAVYLAARGVVLGGTGKPGAELAEMALQKVGASLLVDDVVQAASVLLVAAKVSVIVHGPYYANLAQE